MKITQPDQCDNPRMKAFLLSGGTLYNGHGSYTNCFLMGWIGQRWLEFDTLTLGRKPVYLERPARTKAYHKSFDLWLQQNHGKMEWFYERYEAA